MENAYSTLTLSDKLMCIILLLYYINYFIIYYILEYTKHEQKNTKEEHLMEEKYNKTFITTYKKLLQINQQLNETGHNRDHTEQAPGILWEIRNKNIETIQLLEKYIHKGVIKNDTN